MGLPAYLSLGGINGPMAGGTGPQRPVDRKGHIPVFGYSHRMHQQIDLRAKLPGEVRRHGILWIRKNVDCASPGIHKAQTANRLIDPWQLDFVRTPRSGPAYNYLSVTLTKARIVRVRTVMPPLTHPDTQQVHEYEDVGFTYDGIAWLSKKGEGSEGTGFRPADPRIVRPEFEPDWVEEHAKTAVLVSLGLIGDAVKAGLMAEARRKWEQGNE